MRRKHRGYLGYKIAPQTGATNVNAVMSDADIPVIRERHARGDSYRVISKDYGVYPSTICQIVRRRTWAHIT